MSALTDEMLDIADVRPYVKCFRLGIEEVGRLCHVYDNICKRYPFIYDYDYRNKESQAVASQRCSELMASNPSYFVNGQLRTDYIGPQLTADFLDDDLSSTDYTDEQFTGSTDTKSSSEVIDCDMDKCDKALPLTDNSLHNPNNINRW